MSLFLIFLPLKLDFPKVDHHMGSCTYFSHPFPPFFGIINEINNGNKINSISSNLSGMDLCEFLTMNFLGFILLQSIYPPPRLLSSSKALSFSEAFVLLQSFHFLPIFDFQYLQKISETNIASSHLFWMRPSFK